MAGVIKAANTVFAVGYLFGSIGAVGNAGVALPDNIPFGQLQDIQIDDSLEIKELMGQGQLTAVSVGVGAVKITGSAKFAAIRARQVQMMRGGGPPTFTTATTTFQRKLTDEPTPFNLHLKSPSDGSDVELKIYNCISPKLTYDFKLRDYVIPDFSFNVYGDPTSGIIMEWLLPGDQTTS
jgi:hypothetical protein